MAPPRRRRAGMRTRRTRSQMQVNKAARASSFASERTRTKSQGLLAEVIHAATLRKLDAVDLYDTKIERNVVSVLDSIGQYHKEIPSTRLENLLNYIGGLLQQRKRVEPTRFPFRTFEVFTVALLFASQPEYLPHYIQAANSRKEYPGGAEALIREYTIIFENTKEMMSTCREICKMSEISRKPGKCTLIENWIIVAYMIDRHPKAKLDMYPEYARIPVIKGMVTILINIYQGIIEELIDPAFLPAELKTGWDTDEDIDLCGVPGSTSQGSTMNKLKKMSPNQGRVRAMLSEDTSMDTDPSWNDPMAQFDDLVECRSPHPRIDEGSL